MKITSPKVNALVGHEVSIKTVVSVKKGYHIQAHEVADELIIPTRLEIVGDKDFVIKKQVFPPTKKFQLTGTDQQLEVYDGEFEIETSLLVLERIQKGVVQLKGKLKYQACDSVRCLFPRTVEFLVDVVVQ
ncbi:MAG: protein-disulfide reductase DsbD domain-containing protein [Bacteroidota bacterium]